MRVNLGAALAATAAAASNLLAVLRPDGSYGVNVSGVPFLASGQTSVCSQGTLYSVPGDFNLTNYQLTSGSDAWGAWTGQSLSLTAPGVAVSLHVHTYTDTPAAVFTMSFDAALNTTGCGGQGDLSTYFPAWTLSSNASSLVSSSGTAVTWSGEASQNTQTAVGIANLASSGLAHGPVVLMDVPSRNTVVISSLDAHKILGQYTDALAIAPVLALWSQERAEQVACVSVLCNNDQKPNGDYIVQRIEGYGLSGVTGKGAARGVRRGGYTYATQALSAVYSSKWDDNIVTTNATMPDSSYNFDIANGYVLAASVPGSVPLQLWFRAYNASHQDYATVASQAGVQWAQSNNYTFVANIGYVFTSAEDAAAALALMREDAADGDATGPDTPTDTYARGVTAAIVADIPAGWSYSCVVYAGQGITSTTMSWGAAMQAWYNTTRMPTATLSDISVYTDDGAYFYVWENIPPRPWAAEDGLFYVLQGLRLQGVQPQALQLDDWWYEGRFYFGNVKCVNTWVGDNSSLLFPNGIPAFQKRIGIPLILYTPFWCDTYETNFTMVPSNSFQGTKVVVANQSYAFFADVMQTGQNLANGNMIGYEIDFLGSNFLGNPSLFEDVNAAFTWYAGMAQAALEQGITIQYCLSYPSDILVSLSFPSVTNARASPDYVNTESNAAAVGGSSLLFGALAIAPSKDVFWTRSPQPPTYSDVSRNYTTQPHVQLDAMLATFSLGPVGFGDAVDLTDAGLLNQTCMANGTVLRPMRPMSWVDSHFLNISGAQDVRITHAELQGAPSPAAWYILAWQTSQPVALTPGDMYPQVPAGSVLAVRYHNWTTGFAQDGCVNGSSAAGCVTVLAGGQLPVIDATSQVNTNGSDTLLLRATPQLSNGWFFLGELSRFASHSHMRTSSLVSSPDGIAVSVAGSNGEDVCMTAVLPALTVQVQCVTIGPSGAAVIAFA